MSNLATVIILGKESPYIFFTSTFDKGSRFFGSGIPGKIICILDGLIPTLIANSFVKFELAIIKSALSVLLIKNQDLSVQEFPEKLYVFWTD